MEIDQSSDSNKDGSVDITLKSINEEIKDPNDYVSRYKIN